jgi:hypothetical protein
MWISHVASKTLSAHADPTTPAGEDGFSGRLLPRPPTAFPLWQEGRLQRETIEACSGFTCFSACAFAPRLHRGLPRRLQPDDYSSSAAPVATGRTDNSPGGTSTRWPSRPRRSLCNLRLSSHQTSLPVALPPGLRRPSRGIRGRQSQVRLPRGALGTRHRQACRRGQGGELSALIRAV